MSQKRGEHDPEAREYTGNLKSEFPAEVAENKIVYEDDIPSDMLTIIWWQNH